MAAADDTPTPERMAALIAEMNEKAHDMLRAEKDDFTTHMPPLTHFYVRVTTAEYNMLLEMSRTTWRIDMVISSSQQPTDVPDDHPIHNFLWWMANDQLATVWRLKFAGTVLVPYVQLPRYDVVWLSPWGIRVFKADLANWHDIQLHQYEEFVCTDEQLARITAECLHLRFLTICIVDRAPTHGLK